MRPDAHKQAASRKYHNKVKARGGSVGASGAGRGGGVAGSATGNASNASTHHNGSGGAYRGGMRGGRGGSRANDDDDDDGEDGDEGDSDEGPSKSYARRKILSNADRYIELDEKELEAQDLEKGIDRQTLDFEQLLSAKDQENRNESSDPTAYFRFKSEQAASSALTSSNNNEVALDSGFAKSLLELDLSNLEQSLMTLPFRTRLNLLDESYFGNECFGDQEDDELDKYGYGKVSFKAGTPIVPRMIHGGEKVGDVLTVKKSTLETTQSSPPSSTAATTQAGIKAKLQEDAANARRLQSRQEKVDELEDLLAQSQKTTVSVRDLKTRPSAASPATSGSKSISAPSSRSIPTPPATKAGLSSRPVSKPVAPATTARRIPLPSASSGGSKSNISHKFKPELDDDVLDDLLG